MYSNVGRFGAELTPKSIKVKGEDVVVLNNVLFIEESYQNTVQIPIEVFGNKATNMAQQFNKGDELFVEGYFVQKHYNNAEKEVNVPYLALRVTNYKFVNGKHRKTSPSEELKECPDILG